MLKLIKAKLNNQKGAMENVLVALFLVIIGVGALIGFSSWIQTEKEGVQQSASTKVQSVTQNAAGN